ncbi:MAG: trigger factor [Parcubacteria group bacterium]|nr:trigger factor [Parcubacteria group bacterium]
MQITENKPNPAVLELAVELARADIERDLQAAAKRLAGHIEVPGFRKGAAPYDILSRHVGGEAKIYEGALQAIVGRTLESAIRERGIEVAGNPDISITKMVPPFGVSYKAVMVLLPSVVLGDVSKIKVQKKDAAATEADVAKAVQTIREMHATEAAVGRPAEQGDKVILDLEVKRDGVVIEHGAANDFPLTLGESRFIPGFEEQIIGLKAGGKKEFELKFPEQYYAKSLAGKPAQFSVSVKQVFERTVPEMDDAFAQELGHSQTAEDLREQIRRSLQYEKEREERERFEMAAMDELVKRSEFGEIPDQLIAREARKMLAELEQNVIRQGMKFGDYLESIKKSKEDLEKEFRPKAGHRVKISLVGREFGKQERVQVSDDEVARELAIAKKAYASQPELAAELESREYRDYVRNMLASRKIFRTLAEKVSK